MKNEYLKNYIKKSIIIELDCIVDLETYFNDDEKLEKLITICLNDELQNRSIISDRIYQSFQLSDEDFYNEYQMEKKIFIDRGNFNTKYFLKFLIPDCVKNNFYGIKKLSNEEKFEIIHTYPFTFTKE